MIEGLKTMLVQQFFVKSMQSLNLEHKWVGAPFAAMLRRHQSDFNDSNDCVLKIVIVLLSTNSNVVQVKYLSIALQVNQSPYSVSYPNSVFTFFLRFWISFFFFLLLFYLLL